MKHLKYSYDKDADVLYLSLGPPKAAQTHNEQYGILIRKDYITQETIGLTIVGFKHQIDHHVPIPEYLNELSLPPEIIDFVKRVSTDPSSLNSLK